MSTTITATKIKECASPWLVPPECGGQIVERAYAHSTLGDGIGFCRVTDRSVPIGRPGRVSYEWCDMDDCGCVEECDCWDPINREPSAYEFHQALTP